MTEIRYQTYTVPITIDGPCPICGTPFTAGDSITTGYPVTHRACDPIANYVDNTIARALKTMSAQLDRELGD